MISLVATLAHNTEMKGAIRAAILYRPLRVGRRLQILAVGRNLLDIAGVSTCSAATCVGTYTIGATFGAVGRLPGVLIG